MPFVENERRSSGVSTPSRAATTYVRTGRRRRWRRPRSAFYPTWEREKKKEAQSRQRQRQPPSSSLQPGLGQKELEGRREKERERKRERERERGENSKGKVDQKRERRASVAGGGRDVSLSLSLSLSLFSRLYLVPLWVPFILFDFQTGQEVRKKALKPRKRKGPDSASVASSVVCLRRPELEGRKEEKKESGKVERGESVSLGGREKRKEECASLSLSLSLSLSTSPAKFQDAVSTAAGNGPTVCHSNSDTLFLSLSLSLPPR
jgi:hypothetical protein